MLIATEFQ